tara:strand:- start:1135 stop:2502 length:1368 start_codon:yes stop_codon:yes gene_type:complete
MAHTGTLLLKCLSVLLLSLATSTATAGLSGLRYQLSLEPGKFWEVSAEADQFRKSLRGLAEFGVADAQMLLADQFASSGSFAHLRQSAHWYQEAYANGRTDAPGALARVVSRKPLPSAELLPYFRGIVPSLSPEKDFDSLLSLLEIQFSYPELADARADRLLKLYKRACINTCFHDLFGARAAELNNRDEDARRLYRQAARSSGRGVNAYFDFLERYEDRDSRFNAFSDELSDSAEALSPDVIQSVAGKLQSINSDFSPAVLAWLDLAVEKGAPNAAINRIEYMLGLPESFSFDQTEQRITAVATSFPTEAKLLRAQLLTTRAWKRLDPFTAYDLLKDLQSRGVTEAHVGLGDLYSMGGLDEVDQFQAIEEYKKAAKKGYASAFYKIASIYRFGRSMCNDALLSHAYGRMALMLGEEKAEEFVQTLSTELSQTEASQADHLYRELVLAYPIKDFE